MADSAPNEPTESTPTVPDTRLQEFLEIGTNCVNAGKHQEAILIFDRLHETHPSRVEPLLGRGSAFALTGKYEAAESDFKRATTCSPRCADAWIRLGQTQAAMGMPSLATLTLTTAIDLERTSYAHEQRGILYRRQGHEERACADFEACVECAPAYAPGWDNLAISYNALGYTQKSLAASRRALHLDPSSSAYLRHLGKCLQDSGDAAGAIATFEQALQIQPTSMDVYDQLANVRYFSGDARGALDDLRARRTRCARPELSTRHPLDSSALRLEGVASHSLGKFSHAAACYDQVLSADPNHNCWFLKRVLLVVHGQLDAPWSSFDLDGLLSPSFKDVYSKHGTPVEVQEGSEWVPGESGPQSYVLCTDVSSTVHTDKSRVGVGQHGVCPEDSQSTTRELVSTADPAPVARDDIERDAPVQAILSFARQYGPRMQYRSPGFVVNVRQQRMFSLAVLQVAQHCVRVWDCQHTTRETTTTSTSTDHAKHVSDGRVLPSWRRAVEIAVKWRQISEPNDAVFWIDRLDAAAFQSGFGLETPVVSRYLRVVRYYPYFEPCLALVKTHLLSQCEVASRRREIQRAKTAAELRDVVGRDFFVTTACLSSCEGEQMEGTRLTIRKMPLPGVQFSIRTPSTPTRFDAFSRELAHAWDEIRRLHTTSCENSSRVYQACLAFYFYWVQLGALSRGTSACGLVVLNALLLVFNLSMPTDHVARVQLDWEAILRTSPREFFEHVQTVYPVSSLETVELSRLPRLDNATIPDVRTAIHLCNLEHA